MPMRVRPNEPVRLVLSEAAGEERCPSAIVWAVAVPTAHTINYRAGVKLARPDAKGLERYCARHGGAPDRTFGGE